MRLSALQASWRRDRWVAKRRIALRWLAWFGWRYGLPALGAIAVLAFTWSVVLGWPSETAAEMPVSPSLSIPAPMPTKAAQDDPGVRLRFDPAWPDAALLQPQPRHVPSALPAASTPDAATPFTPHLKPENWLHSKEP
ncbi:hypothetical protein [Hydrogenophaga sp. PAMC20947]|uniref:hypothetical protein n=1 Tax=Hydrogenophaga sp. PAMC20947 TaxID=2565558 RepID=UPI00109E1165|nr:hypothetical protein [Hydrogenophaga sp. PAMC20947]QCB45353.1 hypothetical protein E5678_04510 [Hydrogenophaga sp. PAMC20947]